MTTHINPNANCDPTGRCFICYRRSQLSDVQLLVEAFLDVGVPPWQDRRNLNSEPLGPALRDALTDKYTAGVLIWISRDLASSPTVLEIEAPTALERARSDSAFFVELWLANGMDFASAASAFQPAGTVEDVAVAWNLKRAEVNADERLKVGEPLRIAGEVLARRLAILHASLPHGTPLRILFNAFGETPEAFVPGYPIQIQWSRHFDQRFAPQHAWASRLIPALETVLHAIRRSAPGRPIQVEGRASLSAALALGRVFREVAGINVSWLQHPSGMQWSLSAQEVESGFIAEPLRELDVKSKELAVFVSVTGSVEPAVAATRKADPGLAFRAIASIRPTNGATRRDIQTAGAAAHLAHLVANTIREARTTLRVVERTHLFLAGPSALAGLIGQQLNALGPVQTYEHLQHTDAVGRYIPAALLLDKAPTLRV